MINTALNYLSEGLNPLPLNDDKSPALAPGHDYLYNPVNDNDIDRLFIKAKKIGIACGLVSGNFECIDFDAHDSEPIRQIFNDFMKDAGVTTITEMHALPICKTPSGGYHIYYRYDGDTEAGRPLAKWSSGKVMIETRGNGQYVATIPSEGYSLIHGNELIKISTISQDERDYLLSLAESFNQYSKEIQQDLKSGKSWPSSYDTTTAWGRFNQYEVDEAKDILIDAGWQFDRVRRHDGVELWRRPGKDKGISATFGKYFNMFYNYSESSEHFQGWTAYSLFDILYRVKFKGDKVDAIKYLENKYDIQHYKPVVRINTINFPVNIFPENIQNYIEEQNKVSNFDVNLMASMYLWLGATLIGNRLTTFINDNWNVSPVVWLMIIAERGSTKTHAINAIIRPAKNIDSENRRQFEEALKRYDPEDKSQKRPTWRQIFLEDGTREGYIKALSINPQGLGLMKDELNGWVADMDKHSGSKGGDEAFWLSSFNNSSYTKNIKGDDGSHVARMFINLSGSIQPTVINDLAKNHTVNGLFDRFLLVPYKEGEFLFSMKKPELSYHYFYNSFIEFCISYIKEFDTDHQTFYFDPSAESEFEQVYNHFLSIKYKDDNPNVSSYIAKLITYLPRLILVIEVTEQLYNVFTQKVDQLHFQISKDSVNKAFDVCKYFLNNARTVLFDIDKKRTISDILKASGAIKKVDKCKVLLEAVLSKEIDATQSEIAYELGMSKQLVKYWYNKVKEKMNISTDNQKVK